MRHKEGGCIARGMTVQSLSEFFCTPLGYQLWMSRPYSLWTGKDRTMVASIMVVDDDQTILALLDEILTPVGYEVHLYTYGVPDLAELRHVQPDLVICDYLADRDNVGGDLLATLRHDPDFATTPLIVCSTAHMYLRASTGWRDQPGVSIVPKPFDIDELLGAVQQALAPPPVIPVPAGVRGGRCRPVR
jgi:two-component system alkaline phosphatase synthesis response regulator PhoP